MDTADILKALEIKSFRPFPLARTGWSQTIVARYWPQRRDIRPDLTHVVELPDQDKILLMENRPNRIHKPRRYVLMVHGLTGCYRSNYMIRLCRKFLQQGFGVIRMNLRGCGPGFGLAKNPYHSGRSEDTRAVLAFLSQTYSDIPVTQVGFSLGGNITLKMAGEDGAYPTGNLDSVIAVSPPADLAASATHLSHERNRLFDQHFVKELIKDIERLHQHFPELPRPQWPDRLTLTEFDDIYTAPRSGFKDAQDYYKKSSSLSLLSKIRIPALLLSSLDDPVVESQSLKKIALPENLDIVLTEKGGHVGFLGWTGRSFRWMDELLLRWLRQVHGSL